MKSIHSWMLFFVCNNSNYLFIKEPNHSTNEMYRISIKNLNVYLVQYEVTIQNLFNLFKEFNK